MGEWRKQYKGGKLEGLGKGELFNSSKKDLDGREGKWGGVQKEGLKRKIFQFQKAKGWNG